MPAKVKNTTKKQGQKRQRSKQKNVSKRRKLDLEYEQLGDIDSWDWNEVSTTTTPMAGDLGGFLCLEEIDDVAVDYEGDDQTGRVAKFKRIKKEDRKAGKPAKPNEPMDIEEMKDFYDIDTFDDKLFEKAAKKSKKIQKAEFQVQDNNDSTPEEEEKEEQDVAQSEDEASDAVEDQDESKAISPDEIPQDVDVSAWESFQLAEPIMDALKYHKFTQPTPIQEKTLSLALKGRHIVGAAETGSGKTLAFSMPIVQHILANSNTDDSRLYGLILTPTRELAMQVKDHIVNIAKFSKIKVAAIVGGMSIDKQQRLLKNQPNIIVATPGRLWEIFSGEPKYMDMLKHIKFLVLDEADRMLEKGRFEELTSILDVLSDKKQFTTDWPEEAEGGKVKSMKRHNAEHQTFVFTATLGTELRFHKPKKQKAKTKQPGSMQDLVERLNLVGKNPAIVDITTEKAVASRLVEAKIDCVKEEKDLYVYYFVTRYPGRTIIFVNSIDAIRRLIPVFKLLNIEVLGLHAQMQQRQRLKNLDRFKASDKAVLVASDVAARGLDIPSVDHVIHYQIPRSGEIYVHRSGRTARANHEGVSLQLCGPEEVKVYTKLCRTFRKGEQYPDFPVDLGILNEMKKRVQLATEIDKLEHQEQKRNHEDNWLRNMAAEMDVDYEPDNTHQPSSKTDNKIRSKKGQLKQLLTKPMLPFGVSQKYITGGVIEGLADRIIENNKGKNKLLPTQASTKALEDIRSRGSK
ncbi:P-loop containing nucleoside triphosphate hydrolase protein [Lichtheimia hyalospora FSU 10163]|nr:P-loop containing nucleoside triphosphate hydrolase protein [Lichtheimia hyalospora FSU 10163]